MWYDDCDCSAGLAIQGEYVYTAARGSVTSAEALRFPFIPLITLTNAFLRFPFMTNVVTDTHFYQVPELPSLCRARARCILLLILERLCLVR